VYPKLQEGLAAIKQLKVRFLACRVGGMCLWVERRQQEQQ